MDQTWKLAAACLSKPHDLIALILISALDRLAAGLEAPSNDITEGYAADYTMVQLREAAQRISDRIDELIRENVFGA